MINTRLTEGCRPEAVQVTQRPAQSDINNLYHGHVLIRVLIMVPFISQLKGCKDCVKKVSIKNIDTSYTAS